MKKLIIALSIASVVTLSGCATSPMIQENHNNDLINGYHVKVDNLKRIDDKKINIQFKVADGADVGKFLWTETQEDVKSQLEAKGIELTKDGRPVTVFLDNFTAWGSNYAQTKIARGFIPGGAIASVGGSIAQDVIVRAVDRKMAKDSMNEASGDGKHFVPQVQFTIVSEGYKTTVDMMSDEALYSYLDNSKQLTSQAITEFFTGTK